MFINLSNHPSENWNKEQLAAAHEYGEIVDFPYPPVDAYSTADDIHKMVEKYLKMILDAKPAAIMVCGEFNFTFQMVDALLMHDVNVLTAASGRDTVEVVNPDGTSTKTSNFHFRSFRKYEYFKPLLHDEVKPDEAGEGRNNG